MSPLAPRPAVPFEATRVEVVAAVLLGAEGRFLLGQRPPGKVYSGYWEFPGGKVEPGETPLAALKRELHEELGIEVERAYPWLMRDYDYEHAAVRLRFFRVARWHGTLQGRENQRFVWQHPGAVSVAPLLPANAPILRALALPAIYAITNAAEVGEPAFLSVLDRALDRGLRLLQVREKRMADARLEGFAATVVRIAHARGARVLINDDADLARRVGADGVHLTAAQLRQLARRPDLELVGASCHDAEELARAHALGANLAVLGPVLPTPSHPGADALGWTIFSALARDSGIPLYALGGLAPADLDRAFECGAHGISMMRGAWQGAQRPQPCGVSGAASSGASLSSTTGTR